jgi:putative transposase
MELFDFVQRYIIQVSLPPATEQRMGNSNYTRLYIHFIWGTQHRAPLIDPELAPLLHATLGAKCEQLGCQVFAIGGVADHVHLLLSLPRTLTIAQVAGTLKGHSSYAVSHMLRPGMAFRWQTGYSAFTVNWRHLRTVQRYIENQPEHHRRKRLMRRWELPD